ncbi:MAG: aminoacyl-tRNA hydrolase [Acidiferrobacteraceae bacterium]|jgi:PTH1 family peptidyl-tRNA hydrolase|nr:aminoacyl-tRNA hydrolase [Acidiferrobacteraceae bacterium]MDP6434894.1 aminoacyl-tRNA hydrolase [Arenicellales bacterium]MDP6673060.1 aminoacyl-tRNA hydrolase [Arenicellales bacterium]MDP6724051.1 aminoacyl-tRNA hydrolase [Arenicellales bacterium]|tara:strand:- start:2216 stop:2800 length:585 start_codon:yes stop_codon:yes gene_type:complete
MGPVSLVVGLGNPGQKHARDRHNAGYWFLEALISGSGGTLASEPKFFGDVGRLTVAGSTIRALAPTTYMNRSGSAVSACSRFYRIAPENILVIHDDLDLPPGVVRLKQGGGHGGHNGLRDIITQLGSRDFQRLRLGIGHPGSADQVVSYVLKRPGSDEEIAIRGAIDRVLPIMPEVISGKSDLAMNALHCDPES